MEYVYGLYTNEGRVKEINQDAVFIMQAITDNGPVLFAAISDGMGGLARGEEASSRMLRFLKSWFVDDLPGLVYSEDGVTESGFRRSMLKVIQDACDDIAEYASGIGSECGTTLSAVLLSRKEWFAVNVGDSRVYMHDGNHLTQITKDHSFVQREIDAGRLTEEEARTHKMRSILLQCIGASDVVIPDWYHGTFSGNNGFMLCSDGFRHYISKDELATLLKPTDIRDSEQISVILGNCAERSMDEGERDNISAIFIKTEEGIANVGNRFRNRRKI